MTKTIKRSIVISSIIAALIAITGVIVLVISLSNSKFRLDEEYYGKSEKVSISKDEYEKLISKKKSFVVMTDNNKCIATSNMSGFMSEMPADRQFKYYRLAWPEALESSLHEKVKFAPSIAIIHNGEVVAFLDAESEKDEPAYNGANALQAWFERYISF